MDEATSSYSTYEFVTGSVFERGKTAKAAAPRNLNRHSVQICQDPTHSLMMASPSQSRQGSLPRKSHSKRTSKKSTEIAYI